MKHLIAFVTLAGTLLLATLPARAAIISYDFSVSGNAGAGSGSFSFDDSQGTAGFIAGQTEYRLLSFDFSFGGQSYGLAALDSNLRLAVFAGTTFLGLEATQTSTPPAFQFTPGTISSADAFLVAGNATSSISYRNTSPQAVPAPATPWLLAAVLPLLAAFSRRRAARGAAGSAAAGA